MEPPVRGLMYGQLLGVLGNVFAEGAEARGMIVVWVMLALGLFNFLTSLCTSYFLGVAGEYILR